jgi:hypothetical protein
VVGCAPRDRQDKGCRPLSLTAQPEESLVGAFTLTFAPVPSESTTADMDLTYLPHTTPERLSDLAKTYARVRLELEKDSKDIASYLQMAIEVDWEEYTMVLSALVNAAQEERYWPNFRDGEGVKRFVDLASLPDPHSLDHSVSTIPCLSSLFRLAPWLMQIFQTPREPCWSMPIAGLVNSLLSLDRADKVGKKLPADAKALQDLMDGYSQIVRNVWEDKRYLDSIHGPDVSLSPRIYVSCLILKLGIRELAEPGYVYVYAPPLSESPTT